MGDFSKETLLIEAIPMINIDRIAQWLSAINVNYYESRANLNWKQLLKIITNDPFQFHNSGGWTFLSLESSDTEEDELRVSEYKPENDEFEEEDQFTDQDSTITESVIKIKEL